jgi:hypothetical protein
MDEVLDSVLDDSTEPPGDTPETIETKILSQTDVAESIYSEQDSKLPGIIWVARESEAVGKRVTNIYKYYELLDGETVIGRQLSVIEKVVTDFGIPVAMEKVQTVGRRRRGE